MLYEINYSGRSHYSRGDSARSAVSALVYANSSIPLAIDASLWDPGVIVDVYGERNTHDLVLVRFNNVQGGYSAVKVS